MRLRDHGSLGARHHWRGVHHLHGDLVARIRKLEGRREQDVEQWEAWHRHFHDALARACGSPLLLQFCAQLQSQFARYRKLFLSANPFDREVAAEHDRLAAAALARDADGACAVMEAHIERTGRNILAAVQE